MDSLNSALRHIKEVDFTIDPVRALDFLFSESERQDECQGQFQLQLTQLKRDTGLRVEHGLVTNGHIVVQTCGFLTMVLLRSSCSTKFEPMLETPHLSVRFL